jgi:hypothetical protein
MCKQTSDCNFDSSLAAVFNITLPDGWDTEGECSSKTCCQEPSIGNATCFSCRNNDGSVAIGRLPPACADCPGWDGDIDVNGQTICNGHGTCVGNDVLECKCQRGLGNSRWKGDYCECLATTFYSDDCQSCAQGFYVPADVSTSIENGISTPVQGKCVSCPGAESGTGLAACNFKNGYGQCIYHENVGTQQPSESSNAFSKRVEHVGSCACTVGLLDAPVVGAFGTTCEDAPPNFYNDGNAILACPRVLPLEVSKCTEPWSYVRTDGTPEQACTQTCGAKPGFASCDSNGQCICNTTEIELNGGKAHYYKGNNGLCVRSKIK